jgi:hypothetical protein
VGEQEADSRARKKDFAAVANAPTPQCRGLSVKNLSIENSGVMRIAETAVKAAMTPVFPREQIATPRR